MPPEVVARLDDVLADLRSDSAAADVPTSPDGEGTVVSLERRRRSRFAKVVLAAAAVVVVGYGVGQVATGTLSGSGGGSDSGAVADKNTADRGTATDGGGDSGSGSSGSAPEGYAPLDDLGIAGLEAIDPDNPADSLTTLRDEPADGQLATNRRALEDVCGPRRAPRGARLVPATYDGHPTLVLFRAPEAGSQRVDLYRCDAPTPRTPFRTVTLDGE